MAMCSLYIQGVWTAFGEDMNSSWMMGRSTQPIPSVGIFRWESHTINKKETSMGQIIGALPETNFFILTSIQLRMK